MISHFEMDIFHRYHDYSQNTDEKQGLQNEKPVQQRPDASQKARYLKKAMHKQSAMHPIFMKSQIKRCIQFAKCISNESFSPKSDASIPPNASQSITYLKKEMHASRIMHRNQHNIPKIRCIRCTRQVSNNPLKTNKGRLL